MRTRFLDDADTLHVELKAGAVVETRKLGADTVVGADDAGPMLAVTIEHAQPRVEMPAFSYQQIAA